MPERYNMVFRLPPRLYLEGSPVFIEAGAIQKDTQTNNLLVQLKFRNISSKTMIACKVKINAYSVSGDQLEGVDSFSYLDLNVHSGEEFGSKTPIYLPNYETRKFAACVTQVVFADNSIWNADATEWSQVSEPTKIENGLHDDSRIHDGELVKQYKIEVGNNSDYYPEIKDGLFYCTCGNINMDSVDHCYFCRREYSDLARILEDGYLTSRKDARLAREAEERRTKMQREAEERASKLQKRQERKVRIAKILKIAIPSIIALAIIAAGYYVVSLIIIPRQRHNEAMQLIASGKYERAYSILTELGDNETIVQSKNDRALQLLESGNYEEAYALYEELGNSEAIIQSQNDRALQLLESGNYEEAYALYEELGNNEAINSSITDRAMVLASSGDYETGRSMLEEIGNTEAIPECTYDYGLYLVDTGDYVGAYNVLAGLNYSDSNELLESIMPQVYDAPLTDVEVGSYVFFGSYEQDNDLSNGAEPIEWCILEVDGDRILLLSRYALDARQYNPTSATWSNSSLRAWLNDDFYNQAFTASEQNMIQTTDDTMNNLASNDETLDCVFVLSRAQFSTLLSGLSVCRVTDYLEAQEPIVTLEGICSWWLRDVNRGPAFVGNDGEVHWSITYNGYDSFAFYYGVRPAIWIEVG